MGQGIYDGQHKGTADLVVEVRTPGFCPVDSLEWTEDTEFFKTYKSMKRAETGRPHLFRLIAMIHKTAYILAYDMLRRKGGHDWVERRAGGIIGLPISH